MRSCRLERSDGVSRVRSFLAVGLGLLKRDGLERLWRAAATKVRGLFSREARIRACRDRLHRLLEPEEQFLLPTFEPGRTLERDRYLAYQQRFIQFDIRAGERVLDVGSGGYPFPHATHLADLYMSGTSHRSEPLRRGTLPLQQCDLERLPYADHTFDFVYCSHVLEHVKDPAKACEELMRVGKRGYIETPTRLSDVMFNFTRLRDHHKWHVSCVGGALIFMPWEERERRDTQINEFFLMAHSKYKNAFQELLHGHRDLFVNMLLWKERFVYYVFDQEGRLRDTNSARVSAASI